MWLARNMGGISMRQWHRTSLAGLAALGMAAGPAALAQQADDRSQDQGSQAQQQQSDTGMQRDQGRQGRDAQGQMGRGGAGQAGQAGQEKEVTGQVSTIKGNELYIQDKDGVLVPVKTSARTQFEGQTADNQKLSSLKQLNEDDRVTARVIPQQNDNVANSIRLDKEDVKSVSGTVARSAANEFTLDKDGTRVPVNVDNRTKFEGTGANGKQIASARDIKPGDDVRADVVLKDDTRNVARRISVRGSGQQPGIGGAGQQGKGDAGQQGTTGQQGTGGAGKQGTSGQQQGTGGAGQQDTGANPRDGGRNQ